MEGRSGLFSYEELESLVAPVLESYAPSQKTTPQVTHPFWYLRSDGLWEIPELDSMERQASGFPTKAAFRAVSGRLPESLERMLLAHPGMIQQAIQLLIDEHFTPSLEDDIRHRLGLALSPGATGWADPASGGAASRAPRRDPNFRREVLTAYQHRCAVSGYRAALDGQFFGVQAAHFKWHSQGGPDQVSNGLVLNPMLHFLLDAGAWTLSDDRRVLVSARYAGDSDGAALLLQYHGQPMADPAGGYAPIAQEHIHWHRDSDSAVFKGPSLPLP